MSIKRPWAFWRRVQYGAGFFGVLVLLFSVLFVLLYDESVSCFDGIQNGLESGVDCGGDCVRICNAEVFPPKILWAESFEITDGQYNVVAYVENLNEVAATERLEYTFTLKNNGVIVAERSGVTVLPPDSIYPIFEGRVQTNGQPVTDTTITINPVEVWQPATVGIEQFSISNIVLTGADIRPRLDATIENTALTEARGIEIVTTLFSAGGSPLTASQTFVDQLPGRAKQDIVFTWPRSIAKTVRSCTIPSDIVLALDLSGSMNNDGGEPPQPVTAAKNAAANFVNRLNQDDQVAVVSFATEAMTEVVLTRDRVRVQEKIDALTITPEAEVGFTNTVSALNLIEEELSSERHNGDARKAAVLLTDGLPTGTTETEELIAEAIAIAREIQSQEVSLYVIGLGSGVDEEFINNLAEDERYAYLAPQGSDLDAIYEEITGALCESGATRIDVIPKTKTNFTPLVNGQ